MLAACIKSKRLFWMVLWDASLLSSGLRDQCCPPRKIDICTQYLAPLKFPSFVFEPHDDFLLCLFVLHLYLSTLSSTSSPLFFHAAHTLFIPCLTWIVLDVLPCRGIDLSHYQDAYANLTGYLDTSGMFSSHKRIQHTASYGVLKQRGSSMVTYDCTTPYMKESRKRKAKNTLELWGSSPHPYTLHSTVVMSIICIPRCTIVEMSSMLSLFMYLFTYLFIYLFIYSLIPFFFSVSHRTLSV